MIVRPRLSLRHKLILATIVAGLIPIVLGLVFSYWSARETLQVTVGNHFEELATSSARHVDLIVEREILEAENVSLEPLVRSAVLTANSAYDELDSKQIEQLMAERAAQAKALGLAAVPATSGLLTQRLEAFQGLGGEYFQIMVTDMHGAPLAAIRSPDTYVQSVFPWWAQAMAGNLYISSVYQNDGGESLLSLAAPVLGPDGSAIGMVQMVHFVDDLFRPIANLEFGQTGHANLVDSSGYLIVEPGFPAEGLNLDAALLQTVASNRTGWLITQAEHRQAQAIVAFAPVGITTEIEGGFGNKQWYVFIRQDTGEAFASTNAFLTRGLTLGALLIVLLAFLGIVLAQGILQPLERLHGWARQLGEGQLDSRLSLHTGDEIQDLAEAFNRTAGQLQALYQNLEGEVAERTRELATLNAIALTAGQSLELEDVLNAALTEVTHTLKLNEAWILLPKAEGTPPVLRVVARHGRLAPAVGSPVNSGEGNCHCQEVFAGGQDATMVTAATTCLWLREAGRQGHACIPLRAKGHTVGILNVAQQHDAENGPYIEDLLPLLTAVGTQIGVAVENALLYEEVQRKEALRGHLLKRAITAQEEERKRVARELHDAFAQTLTALIMSLEAAEGAIPTELVAVRRHLDRTRKLTAQTLQETRQLIVELRPTLLDDLGLVPAIRWYARLVLEPHDVETKIAVRGDTRCLPPEIETALFRIAQESLSNVARHAEATRVRIVVRYMPDTVSLEVADDGKGFDAGVVLDPDDPTGSLGLMGIQERVFLAGGTLMIDSHPGTGTTIAVTIPATYGGNHG